MKQLIWIAALILAGCTEQDDEKKPAKKKEPTKSAASTEQKTQPTKREEKPKVEEPPAKTIPGPSDPKMNQTAPAEYKVKFETTKGDFVVTVIRSWAPIGADRFYNLVKNGFYDGCRFFRVLPNFMVQFGMNGDPKVTAAWMTATVKDEAVTQSNQPGFITFAKTKIPNSRTAQVFINYGDNAGLDSQGFAPFGKVTDGMEVVKAINSEYREQPDQGAIIKYGNEYLKSEFPNLDVIKSAKVLE